MKVLKVSTVSHLGYDSDIEFVLGEAIPEDMYVVAFLKGITNAKSVIKSFEVVEV
jgi:hypothetical protein